MIAPLTRTVCQHTGAVAGRCPNEGGVCNCTGACQPGPSAFFAALDKQPPVDRETYDAVVKQRDEAVAERDNMVDLSVEVGRIGIYLRHALADRDNYREEADEWRDKHHEAQCRMDEMAVEITELKKALR